LNHRGTETPRLHRAIHGDGQHKIENRNSKIQNPKSKIEGWVFNIQRFSLHDGPGIRTTVFLKGCPLRCPWCHNPEGLESRPQIRLAPALCARCGRCVAVCARGGHEVTPEGHELRLEDCARCGECVEVCPAGALEMVGSRMTAAEVMEVVRRDIPFYETSGGGMTLSGGEPLAQFAFAGELLRRAKAEGLRTAIETSAFAPWERLAALAPLLDLWLVDLKHTDDARHRELTGVSNERILSNIRRMADAGWPLLLRVPWIPQRNAEPAFLDGLLSFLSSLPAAPPVELMLYHRLGSGKWNALGGEAAMPDDIPAARPEGAEPWAESLRAAGFHVTIR
jgi:pyruvate formate lyase activating enzyme